MLWTWFVKLGSNSGSLRKKLWQQDPSSVTLFLCNTYIQGHENSKTYFIFQISLLCSKYILPRILDSQKEKKKNSLVHFKWVDPRTNFSWRARSGKWMGFQSKRRKSHIKGQRSTFILDHRKLEYVDGAKTETCYHQIVAMSMYFCTMCNCTMCN